MNIKRLIIALSILIPATNGFGLLALSLLLAAKLHGIVLIGFPLALGSFILGEGLGLIAGAMLLRLHNAITPVTKLRGTATSYKFVGVPSYESYWPAADLYSGTEDPRYYEQLTALLNNIDGGASFQGRQIPPVGRYSNIFRRAMKKFKLKHRRRGHGKSLLQSRSGKFGDDDGSELFKMEEELKDYVQKNGERGLRQLSNLLSNDFQGIGRFSGLLGGGGGNLNSGRLIHVLRLLCLLNHLGGGSQLGLLGGGGAGGLLGGGGLLAGGLLGGGGGGQLRSLLGGGGGSHLSGLLGGGGGQLRSLLGGSSGGLGGLIGGGGGNLRSLLGGGGQLGGLLGGGGGQLRSLLGGGSHLEGLLGGGGGGHLGGLLGGGGGHLTGLLGGGGGRLSGLLGGGGGLFGGGALLGGGLLGGGGGLLGGQVCGGQQHILQQLSQLLSSGPLSQLFTGGQGILSQLLGGGQHGQLLQLLGGAGGGGGLHLGGLLGGGNHLLLLHLLHSAQQGQLSQILSGVGSGGHLSNLLGGGHLSQLLGGGQGLLLLRLLSGIHNRIPQQNEHSGLLSILLLLLLTNRQHSGHLSQLLSSGGHHNQLQQHLSQFFCSGGGGQGHHNFHHESHLDFSPKVVHHPPIIIEPPTHGLPVGHSHFEHHEHPVKEVHHHPHIHHHPGTSTFDHRLLPHQFEGQDLSGLVHPLVPLDYDLLSKAHEVHHPVEITPHEHYNHIPAAKLSPEQAHIELPVPTDIPSKTTVSGIRYTPEIKHTANPLMFYRRTIAENRSTNETQHRAKRNTVNNNTNKNHSSGKIPSRAELEAILSKNRDSMLTPDMVKEIEAFFVVVVRYDQNDCLQKLVCDVHSSLDDKRERTEYENNIVAVFKILKEALPYNLRDNTYPYRLAANLGDNSRDPEVCKSFYSQCTYGTEKIIELATEVKMQDKDLSNGTT